MINYKLSECFTLLRLKETFLDIKTNYPHLTKEFIEIVNSRDSKAYIGFITRNIDLFIGENLEIRNSDAYPGILILITKNYFALEEAILNQMTSLEAISDSDVSYVIGKENLFPITKIKDLNLEVIFNENGIKGCFDIKKVLKAI